MGELPDVRVSDAERDAAVGELRRHAAEGRLTLEEFEERARDAYAARTRGELDVLARDLPAGPAPAPPPAPVLGPDRLRAVLGTVEQGGRWQVPERLRATAVLGDCRLDLRQATLTGDTVTIEAKVVLGELRILVPPDARVELLGSGFLSDRKVRGAPSGETIPPGMVVRVEGSVVLGDLTVDVATFGERVRGWIGR